ncbi:MAG: N-acetylornithine carbamoyltransferase [Planctomycetes bacterium]|nr:N-acetylornithine carbamoyltransferase [Planctomycetota bacterium]
MKHLLSTQDLGDTEFEGILELAARFKRGESSSALLGKAVGLLFFNPSLRTRVSMDLAVSQLGGTPVTLDVGAGVWDMEYRDGAVMDGDKAEHVREGAAVLGRYVQALGVRSFPKMKNLEEDLADPVIAGFARHAGIPVLNLESMRDHPCQALADALTLREKLGPTRGRKLLLTWAYHPKPLPMAVPTAVVHVATRLGMDVTLAHPEGFGLPVAVMAAASANAKRSGGSLHVTSDATEGFRGADVVYAKSWGGIEWYGDWENEKRARADHRDWLVTEEKMARGAGARFMHCLPVRRNVVVADSVLDGPRSIVLDQAENRLHAQKAILEFLLATR